MVSNDKNLTPSLAMDPCLNPVVLGLRNLSIMIGKQEYQHGAGGA